MERFILRKEVFGGIIYDSYEKSNFSIDEIFYTVIKEYDKHKLKGIQDKFKATDDYDKVLEFMDVLKSKNIIHNDIFNGRIIENEINSKSLSAPTKVFISITDNCNLRCKHCFGDYTNGRNMNIEQFKALLNKLKSIGTYRLGITGGEPFSNPDIYKILEEAIKEKFKVQITTNGTLITDDFFDLIDKYGSDSMSLSISIDGKEDVHDYIRGKGTFKVIKQNINKLIESNVRVIFNTIITEYNIDSLEEFLIEMKNMGILSGSFMPLRLLGRATENFVNDKEYFSLEKKKYVIDILKKHARNTKRKQFFDRKAITPDGKIRIIVYDDDVPMRYLKNKRCGGGISVASIKANGDMTPCIFLDEFFKDRKMKFANVFEEDILDIWNKNEQFIFMRELSYCDECIDCDYIDKENCDCGCVANSYSVNKDVLVKDSIGICLKGINVL